MKRFMMSKKFDKSSYYDFGLYEKNGKYLKKEDNSEWIPCSLYDFGWGKENGFYKIPLGNFNELIKIVFEEIDDEDSFAAASIIMDNYSFELKNFLLTLIESNDKKINYKRLCLIFKLETPFNRTIKKGMNVQKIEQEYMDWTKISNFFSKK